MIGFIGKILHIGIGYIFGLMFGLIIGVTGLYVVLGNGILFYTFVILSLIGIVSLITFLRKDNKIDKINKESS